MKDKIESLLDRFAVVEAELGKPNAFDDQKRYQELSREHSYLSAISETWAQLQRERRDLESNISMLSEETDSELLTVVKEEIDALKVSIFDGEKKLENLLVPPDPNDSRNTILEIRAGTGGDEAAIFVGDCVRMYQYFAGKKGWSAETLSATESDAGGFKEYVMVLSGENVHRYMQYEGGTHRVQRVPVTETQGRVHTSAVTMAVLIEPDANEPIDLDEKDLKIDTYRASGAGGQHVNTTDSAVRITHMPTGVVVQCQEERSQHKNREKAMRVLSAKIAEAQEQKLRKEMASSRATQVGSGDRSERIRTYNFPQNRVTDHRIDLTLYKLDAIMEGDLDELTEALIAYFHQQKLSS